MTSSPAAALTAHLTRDRALLVGRAEALVVGGSRRLLGLTGPPGAGKSTFAAALVAALGARRPDAAAAVPMDGWHLRQAELARRGLVSRKGAPETFDVEGFVALLGRIRSGEGLLAPAFDRAADDVVDDAVEVPAGTPLVVVEGNYLLLDEGAWAGVRPLLDEVWFLDVADEVLRERLVSRHVDGGRGAGEAAAFVAGSDEVNVATVRAARARADVVVRA